MVKFSRFILIATGILVASVSIPSLYWLVFEKVPVSPAIFYSCVIDDFIIVNSSRVDERGTRIDSEGNILTQADYENYVPLLFFRQLIADGRMPESIRGVPLEPALINRHNFSYRSIPRNIDSPQPALFPLIESQSGRVNLEMPDDYFRIGRRGIEFLDARENRIKPDKSEIFSRAMADAGFVFPANIIAGLPTTRKANEEGYFITDSNGKLFNLKMVKGEPLVRAIETPDNFDIIHIDCVEVRTTEYYAYIYTREHGVFLLMDEYYDLQRLPVDGFNPLIHTLRINGDMFFKCIFWSGGNQIKAIAVNDLYEVVNEYEEQWEGRYSKTEGKVFAALFPFRLELTKGTSLFIRLYFESSPGIRWIVTNLILTAGFIIFLRRRGKELSNSIFDIAVVALTGIYGLIVIFVYPNKFGKKT